MSEGLLEIQDATFDTQVLQSEKPVIVDFWAPWCGPCRAIAPLVEDLAVKFGSQIKIGKCNVDTNSVTPGKYNIQTIPTLLFFKQGQVVHQMIGLTDRATLEAAIRKVL